MKVALLMNSRSSLDLGRFTHDRQIHKAKQSVIRNNYVKPILVTLLQRVRCDVTCLVSGMHRIFPEHP